MPISWCEHTTPNSALIIISLTIVSEVFDVNTLRLIQSSEGRSQRHMATEFKIIKTQVQLIHKRKKDVSLVLSEEYKRNRNLDHKTLRIASKFE